MASHSAQDFYDQLAEDYHLIYADWALSVSRQGDALDALVRQHLDSAGPLEVLDCSCGIGTQAIGLAEHGHRVVGSGLSPAAADRAAAEVRRRGLAAATLAADMRSLPFDVRRAVGGMRRVVRDSGMLVLSARDYGDARRSQRRSTVPQVTNSDAGQVVTFQLWHWHDNGVYDFDHVQLLPDGDTWQVRVRRATSRAWALEELTELVRECRFGSVTWHGVEETRFFQPVLTARPVA
jgi:SAM-dependent methyltransferase